MDLDPLGWVTFNFILRYGDPELPSMRVIHGHGVGDVANALCTSTQIQKHDEK